MVLNDMQGCSVVHMKIKEHVSVVWLEFIEQEIEKRANVIINLTLKEFQSFSQFWKLNIPKTEKL